MVNLSAMSQMQMEQIKSSCAKQARKRSLETEFRVLSRQLLTEKAKARIRNAKIIKESVYFKTIEAILLLYKSDQLQEKISDEKARELIKKVREGGMK